MDIAPDALLSTAQYSSAHHRRALSAVRLNAAWLIAVAQQEQARCDALAASPMHAAALVKLRP